MAPDDGPASPRDAEADDSDGSRITPAEPSPAIDEVSQPAADATDPPAATEDDAPSATRAESPPDASEVPVPAESAESPSEASETPLPTEITAASAVPQIPEAWSPEEPAPSPCAAAAAKKLTPRDHLSSTSDPLPPVKAGRAGRAAPLAVQQPPRGTERLHATTGFARATASGSRPKPRQSPAVRPSRSTPVLRSAYSEPPPRFLPPRATPGVRGTLGRAPAEPSRARASRFDEPIQSATTTARVG